jgi:hypothetical protein
MLKKIALVGIFAVSSVVSLGTSTAVQSVMVPTVTTPSSPILRGIGICGAMGCK